jgi:hypothetical protein
LAAGTEIVWLTDIKGTRHGVRVQSIAYVELEGEDPAGGVGFGMSE